MRCVRVKEVTKKKHKVRKVLFMILIKCEKLEVSNKSAR